DQIERMWYLTKAQEAKEQTEQLQRQYLMMRRAMEKLESTDKTLFEDALKKPVLPQFPKQFRLPTETPP
ncbi:hypothetical protein EDD86DRAFT_174038, partial [Gorgonomyces haynaldii]